MKHLSKIGLHDLSQTNRQRKNSLKRLRTYYSYDFMKPYILLSILMLCGCSGGKAGEGKTQPEPVIEAMENVQADYSRVDAESAPAIKQDVGKEGKTVIDTTKIYNMGEVDTPAMPMTTEKKMMSDREFVNYFSSRFKYPDMEPVNGRGTVRLTIERDGSISDVKIVQGIHPELDKEYVRVFKLYPKFKAAIIDGTSVRSIRDFPVVSKAM